MQNWEVIDKRIYQLHQRTDNEESRHYRKGRTCSVVRNQHRKDAYNRYPLRPPPNFM